MDTQSLSFNELSKNIKEAIEAANSTHKPIFITYDGLPKAVLLSNNEYEAMLASKDGQRVAALEEAYIRLLLAVASAMDTHESYLAGHTERVAMLACALAQEMGMRDEEINELRLAALLHDIGEVVIPIDILHKSGKLTESEFDVIRQHPGVGAEFVSVVPRLAGVADVIHAHQERYDGQGYPRGLKGKEIPLHARIIAVADTYDAITNIRLHRESGNHLQAIAELERCSGKGFDPDIVAAFGKIF